MGEEEAIKLPSLKDKGGKRMSSRGAVFDEDEPKPSKLPIGGGILANGTNKDAPMTITVGDRKRFSTLVNMMGDSEAGWVADALEDIGVVLPGGAKITRWAAATEAMFHAAIADKNVAAFVALRDTGPGKPREEIEMMDKGGNVIPINAEVMQDLRRARDAGKVVDVDVGEGTQDTKIVKGASGEYEVARAEAEKHEGGDN